MGQIIFDSRQPRKPNPAFGFPVGVLAELDEHRDDRREIRRVTDAADETIFHLLMRGGDDCSLHADWLLISAAAVAYNRSIGRAGKAVAR